MPESFLDFKDSGCSSVEYRASPQRMFHQPSLHRSSMCSTFCTEGNVQECLLHITQSNSRKSDEEKMKRIPQPSATTTKEMASLGLSPVWVESTRPSELDVVAVLNCIHDLIQLHHKDLRALENMEVEQLKSNSSIDFLQITNTQLKEENEHFKRENNGLHERERQLLHKVKSLQHGLKNEKEEVQKLQSIISTRAGQYNHEMKRKEREFDKLKERLNQLLSDKKDRKQAIDVLNRVGRADGKRSLWKTEKTEAKREEEMYKTLLNDYDNRQRDLLQENAELKKILQQMKKDMVSILKSKKSTKTDTCERFQKDEEEEEEDALNSTKHSVELFSDDAREQLTNGVRLQWRRLKNHMETLDSQVGELPDRDDNSASRQTQEQEMQSLKLEIQKCKDFIQTQQQLLQQQLSSPCGDEVTYLPTMQQEKERLEGEWKTLEEQRQIFDRERSNFTEAAIRLSHERKSFEENRAMWLKYNFLNLSPFPDSNKPQKQSIESPFSIFDTENNPGPGTENVFHSLCEGSRTKAVTPSSEDRLQ